MELTVGGHRLPRPPCKELSYLHHRCSSSHSSLRGITQYSPVRPLCLFTPKSIKHYSHIYRLFCSTISRHMCHCVRSVNSVSSVSSVIIFWLVLPTSISHGIFLPPSPPGSHGPAWTFSSSVQPQFAGSSCRWEAVRFFHWFLISPHSPIHRQIHNKQSHTNKSETFPKHFQAPRTPILSACNKQLLQTINSMSWHFVTNK